MNSQVKVGSFNGRDFTLNELYQSKRHGWIIYKLVEIEFVAWPQDNVHTHRFKFDPVCDLRKDKKPEDAMTVMTAEPSYMHPLSLVDLGTLRLKLDNFIIDAAQALGMK